MNRIIKGEAPATIPAPTTPSTPSAGIVRADVFDARTEARAIVEAAALYAAEARARLTEEVAAARAEGEQRGYEEGLARAAEIIERAHLQRDAVLASSEADLLDLALHAAAKLLGREIEERGAAADIVAQALSAVRRAKAVRVRISPKDAEIVRSQEPALAQRLAQGAALVLIEDASISRGGCAIETESGRIDARLETQLAALRRAVLGDDGPR